MAGTYRRQTDMPSHVVQFTQYLRSQDFDISLREEFDYLKAFSKKIPTSYEEQEALCKALFVKNRKEFLRFDELYTTYWNRLALAEDSKIKEDKKPHKNRYENPAVSLKALKKWLHGGRMEETEEIASYSVFESLMQKEFSLFAEQDHKDLRAVIRVLALRLANKDKRRFISSKKRHNIDLKNTIRESLKSGGEIKTFKYHRRKKKKLNLFLICDVSKSMELYSKFFIEFMYNFQHIDHNLKTFVFSTQLVHISRLLHEGDFDAVLENLSEAVPQWSSGTCIGKSLSQFITDYSRQLNKGSTVLILSDGWDSDDLDILDESMAYIQRKCLKTIWLNPLAGNPEYLPVTKGMQTCFPYIDVFMPLYNLESLKKLTQHL
ncbi:MAG: VWA domain-containing protein [Flavobacteriaceae bacterium]|nr:VWA domain-containing protein [Flavobacteriaceae bacterium]